MRNIQRSASCVLIGMLVLLQAEAGSERTAQVTQACTPLPAGLVGWWPGDGHASDLSANDLDGAVVGDGVTYAMGRVGQAFQFNNENGKVLVGHSPLLDPSQALTIEAWVQPWSPSLENLGQVVDHTGAIGVGGGYALTFQSFHGDTAFGGVHISHGAGTNWDALYSAAMPVNAWYHLLGAYDAIQQRYRFYVNGQDTSGPGRDLLSPDPINYYEQLNFSIGNALSARGGIERGFYGLIDEVRLFDRALTAEEVLAIYESGGAGVCRRPTVCHKPGTPAEKTLEVPDEAVQGHLGHGDTLGGCSVRPTAATVPTLPPSTAAR